MKDHVGIEVDCVMWLVLERGAARISRENHVQRSIHSFSGDYLYCDELHPLRSTQHDYPRYGQVVTVKITMSEKCLLLQH